MLLETENIQALVVQAIVAAVKGNHVVVDSPRRIYGLVQPLVFVGVEPEFVCPHGCVSPFLFAFLIPDIFLHGFFRDMSHGFTVVGACPERGESCGKLRKLLPENP